MIWFYATIDQLGKEHQMHVLLVPNNFYSNVLTECNNADSVCMGLIY